MKRIIFLVLAILLFSCKDKGGEPCQVPPPDFSMWVNKTSEVHKEFINERGNFDSTHIALYKLIGNTKKEYTVEFGLRMMFTLEKQRHSTFKTLPKPIKLR